MVRLQQRSEINNGQGWSWVRLYKTDRMIYLKGSLQISVCIWLCVSVWRKEIERESSGIDLSDPKQLAVSEGDLKRETAPLVSISHCFGCLSSGTCPVPWCTLAIVGMGTRWFGENNDCALTVLWNNKRVFRTARSLSSRYSLLVLIVLMASEYLFRIQRQFL